MQQPLYSLLVAYYAGHPLAKGYIYVSLCYHICVLMLLYMCSHSMRVIRSQKAIYMPVLLAKGDICVLILLYMCHLLYVSSCYHICVLMLYVSSCSYICVLILLYMCPHTTMCLHGTIYVSSCYYMCPHATIYASSCYHMCPHATTHVPSCYMWPL
jgi:hypothetical protein